MDPENSTAEQITDKETSTLMTWSIKTIDQSPRDRKFLALVSFGAPGIFLIYTLWLIKPSADEGYGTPIFFIVSSLLMSLAILAMVRQKTLFNYRVYADHIEYDACLYYPDYTEDLFKGIVIFFVLAVIFLGLFTGSVLLILFGPIFILLGTGGALMSWQRPAPRGHPSLPWNDINFITVDRKHRIIVQHTTDVTLGFEAHCPDNDLFEHYLAFLRTVLRPDVEYIEKVWQRRGG
ncbi:permease [Pseudomonas syringae]|nr:permease [Pseudomonas syringae]